MSDSDETSDEPEELGEEEVQDEAVLEEQELEILGPVGRKPKVYLSPKVSEYEISVSLARTDAGSYLSVIGKVLEGSHYAFLKMDASSKNLTDISVIPKIYKHIMFLDVSDNRINDESLSCLTPMNLVSIYASKNRIAKGNLPPMQHLQVLDLSYNYIRTTEFLCQPKLLSLSLNYNQLMEVVGLESDNLPELKNLEIRGNSLPDLNGICIPNLQELYLAENFITSLVGIEHLVNLRILHLRDNPLSELDGFTANMEHLKYINIRKCELKELSQLQKLECLPHLETIVISENPFASDAEEDYRVAVLVILPKLTKIDKNPVLEEELEEALEKNVGELAGESGNDVQQDKPTFEDEFDEHEIDATYYDD